MKKTVVMLLCLVLALSMFGCGVQKEKPLYPNADEIEQPILSEDAQAKQVESGFVKGIFCKVIHIFRRY